MVSTLTLVKKSFPLFFSFSSYFSRFFSLYSHPVVLFLLCFLSHLTHFSLSFLLSKLFILLSSPFFFHLPSSPLLFTLFSLSSLFHSSSLLSTPFHLSPSLLSIDIHPPLFAQLASPRETIAKRLSQSERMTRRERDVIPASCHLIGRGGTGMLLKSCLMAQKTIDYCSFAGSNGVMAGIFRFCSVGRHGKISPRKREGGIKGRERREIKRVQGSYR